MTRRAALPLLLLLAHPAAAVDDITPAKPGRAEGGLLALPRPAPVAPSAPARPAPVQPAPAQPAAAMACGRKHFCREMTSCAEARFYLRSCGLARLDRDHDGIPCEPLCP